MALRISSRFVRQPAREPMAAISGTASDDIIVIPPSTHGETVLAGPGNDQLFMDSTSSGMLIDGGGGDDVIHFDARDFSQSLGLETELRIEFRFEFGNIATMANIFGPVIEFFQSSFADRLIVHGAPFPNHLFGTTGDDQLYGNFQDDRLVGVAGDDVLDGGTGADTLQGDLGNDRYYVDDVGDLVIERLQEGIDSVLTTLGSRAAPSPIIYVLPAHVENLIGTLGSAQQLQGNALDNVITTTAGADFIYAHDGGVDTVSTGSGNDFLYFGATFTTDDTIDAGNGTDRLGLYGDYVLTFAADSLNGIERLMLYSAAGNDFDYDLTVVDANVAAGALLEVAALSLGAGETLAFNGAAEADGSFWIRSGGGHDVITGGAQGDRILGFDGNDILDGGGGNDVLTGGLGKDLMNGGGGADRFVLTTGAHSVGSSFDVITGFDSREDRIDVALVRASVAWVGGAANAASFESDLLFTEIDVNFDAGHHVLFVVTEGDMANRVFFLDDSNADGAFTPGVDLVVELASPIQLPLPDGPEPLPATFVI